MAEDAGSVYSEVRLKLDNLTHDIMTVSKKFQTLGQSMIAGVNRPSEQVRKSIEELTAKIQSNSQALASMTAGKNTKEYFKELTKAIKDAEKAHDTETWAVKQGEKEKAQALIQEIGHWEKLKTAMESKHAGLADSEETARMASITRLSEEYAAELDRINRLYKTGVVSEQEKARMTQSAQRKELEGLAQLEREYQGYGKEQEKIQKRIKEQAAAYKEVEAAAKKAGKGSSLQAAFNFAGISTGLTAIVDGVKAAGRAVVQFVQEGVAAYQEQEVASARLSAVLKGTGADAWTTMGQLQELATKQSNATGRSVTEIEQMQAVLLGFTSITGDVFEEATEGLINMAAVMGGDLANAANQFGKALDTPAESLSTLTEYGFKFTEQQKEEIEALERAGKQAEAQRIILGSMKNAFGSAAFAINNAVASQSNFNTAIYNFKTTAGESLEKVIRPIRDFFTGIITPMNDATAAAKKYNNALYEIEQVDILTKKIQEFKDEISRLESIEGSDETIGGLNLQIAVMEEELTRLNGVIGGNKVIALTHELEGLEDSLDHNVDILGVSTKEYIEYHKKIREINRDRVMSEVEKNNRLIEEEKKYREAIKKQMADGTYSERNPGGEFNYLADQSAEIMRQIALKQAEIEEVKKLAAEEAANRAKAAEDARQAVLDEKNAAEARDKFAQEHASRLEAIKNLKISYNQAIEKAERDRAQAEQEAEGDTEALAAARAAYAQAEANARQAEIDGLHTLSVEWKMREVADAKAETAVKERLGIHAALIADAREQADITANQAELEKALVDAEDEYNSAVEKARRQREAGVISNEQLERAQADAEEERLKKLQEIELQYRDTAEAAEQLERVRAAIRDAQFAFGKEKGEAEKVEKIAELTEKYKDELLEVQHEKENIQKKNEKELDYQKRLIDNEKEWALAALQGLDEQSEEYKTLVYLIEKVAEAKKELLKDGNKESNLGFSKDDAIQMLNDTKSVLSAAADWAIAETQRQADEKKKILDEEYEANKKRIEDEKKDKLIAAGFEVADSEASLEAQLEAAKRTGDEILIYQAERALEKHRIEQEAADAEKQLTSQLEYDKANIAYEAELQQWKWKIALAAANAAAAAVTTFAQMGFTPPAWVAVGLGAAAAGFQIAAIKAAEPTKPTLPTFATGGIVWPSLLSCKTRH